MSSIQAQHFIFPQGAPSSPTSPLPLSDSFLGSKMFYRILFFLQGREDNDDCPSKIKSFSCVSLDLAHWRLFCLGSGFFSRMFCLPPGNLSDHGSRSLGALKTDLEPLGSIQASCFIRCWKDVECIYNHCVQQHLHPVPISKHGTRGSSPKTNCQKPATARSDLKQAFYGNSAQGWGLGSGVTPVTSPVWGWAVFGEGAGVWGFQQQGTEPRLGCSLWGFFCTIWTHLQNHFDGQHSGAFSAQMILKLSRWIVPNTSDDIPGQLEIWLLPVVVKA